MTQNSNPTQKWISSLQKNKKIYLAKTFKLFPLLCDEVKEKMAQLQTFITESVFVV